MTTPLSRFEDGRIVLGGREVFVNSASLSIQTTLEKERVFGGFDNSIMGSKVEFAGYRPKNGVTGNLSISFYISPSSMSKDNLSAFLELAEIAMSGGGKDSITENPINDNYVGRYNFDNAYLKTFGFEMKPFGLIMANASYDIYGTISNYPDKWLTKQDIDFGHAIKSFGSIKISGAETQSVFSSGFEMLSLKYNILVNRKVSNRIRANENTQIATYAGGAVPTRVSSENIEAQGEIVGTELIDNLNSYGDQQRLSQSDNLDDSVFDIFMYSMQGVKIAHFSIAGKIINQQMNIAENSHAISKIQIQQIIK